MSLIVLGSKYEWGHVQQHKTDKKLLACIYGIEKQDKKTLGINPTRHSLINQSGNKSNQESEVTPKLTLWNTTIPSLFSWTFPLPTFYFSVCYSSSSSSFFLLCLLLIILLLLHLLWITSCAWYSTISWSMAATLRGPIPDDTGNSFLQHQYFSIVPQLEVELPLFSKLIFCLAWSCPFSHNHSQFTWETTLLGSRTRLCCIIHCLWFFQFVSLFFNGSWGQEISPSFSQWTVVSLSIHWQGLRKSSVVSIGQCRNPLLDVSSNFKSGMLTVCRQPTSGFSF